MSAALETPAGSSAALSLAKTASSFTINGDNNWVVDVQFEFNRNISPNQWVVNPPIETIDVTFDTLDQITWNLIPPTGIDPDSLFFDASPITFPQNQVPAPMLVISNPQTNPKQCVAVWANRDLSRTGPYSYTLNIQIADQIITHDPTVENESPTG
jgi:hypothetical protein